MLETDEVLETLVPATPATETLVPTVSPVEPVEWWIVTQESTDNVCNVNDTFDIPLDGTLHLAVPIAKLSGEVTQKTKKGKVKVSVNGEEIGSIIPTLADDSVVIISGTSKHEKNRKVDFMCDGSDTDMTDDWIAQGRPRNPTTIIEGSNEATSSDGGVVEAAVPEPEDAAEDDAAGVGLSVLTPHTYTDVHSMFVISEDNLQYLEIDVYDAEDTSTLSGGSDYAGTEDDLLQEYVAEWMKDATHFWIGVGSNDVPCIVIGQIPSEAEVKFYSKISKKLVTGKVTGKTTGLITAEPTMTADEYLTMMEEKYYWRVFGPTKEHEWDDDEDPPGFDLGDSDTMPCRIINSSPIAYVRYGSIHIFGTDSIVEAKISPRDFVLRHVDYNQKYFKWQHQVKEAEFVIALPNITKEVNWRYNGKKI